MNFEVVLELQCVFLMDVWEGLEDAVLLISARPPSCWANLVDAAPLEREAAMSRLVDPEGPGSWG